MAATAISALASIDTAPSFMKDQMGIVIAELPTNPEDALTGATFKYIGQSVAGSTTFAGDEATTTDQKDEQGNVVFSNTTNGTQAFNTTLYSTSKDILEKFFKGVSSTAAITVGNLDGKWDYTAFGKNLAQTECMIGFVNGDGTQILLYPKASVSANLVDGPASENSLKVALKITAQSNSYKIDGKNDIAFLLKKSTAL